MQKLMKNWIFTLVIAVLLLCFGVIMFTPLGEDAMDVLVASGLVVYTVLVLADNVIHYDGKLRIFAIAELILVAVLIVGLIVEDYKIFPVSGVSGSVGAIMWLRAFVEVIHGYYLQENVGRAKAESSGENGVELGKVEHFGFGKMLACIAFLSIGVALICADPSEIEVYIRYSIGIISVLLGATMAFITYRNRSDKRDSYRVGADGAAVSGASVDTPKVGAVKTDAEMTGGVAADTVADAMMDGVANAVKDNALDASDATEPKASVGPDADKIENVGACESCDEVDVPIDVEPSQNTETDDDAMPDVAEEYREDAGYESEVKSEPTRD